MSGERCETCRFWTKPAPDWQFGDVVLGKCAAVKMRSSIEEDACRAAAIPRDDWWDEGQKVYAEAFKAVKAIVVDGSGYYAALETTAEFGCVLWEGQP